MNTQSIFTVSRSSYLGSPEDWQTLRASAALRIGAGDEEVLAGDSFEIYDAAAATKKAPYGDVEYGDPGYRNGVKRYPLSSPEKIRAAWNYIHHKHNAGFYTPAQLAHIKGKIVSAWKAKIDKSGPPAAKP